MHTEARATNLPHPWRQRGGFSRRNLAIYLVGAGLIAGTIVAYARIAAWQTPSGPEPGFRIVSASWDGVRGGARLTQDIGLGITNGESHVVRLQSIELVPSGAHGVSFIGRVRSSPWSTAHVTPGPWVLWRGGSRLSPAGTWKLQPDVGLYLEGTVSRPGLGVTTLNIDISSGASVLFQTGGRGYAGDDLRRWREKCDGLLPSMVSSLFLWRASDSSGRVRLQGVWRGHSRIEEARGRLERRWA